MTPAYCILRIKKMTYPEALRFLETLVNFERLPSWSYTHSLKNRRFHRLMHCLGDPQAGMRLLHVAGTKGKGSTCALLSEILRQAGLRVGLYTSPHLHDPRERIRILEPGRPQPPAGPFEGMISRRSFCRLLERVRPHARSFAQERGLGKPTFFEVYTAVAFLYFRARAVDWAVLETGMGGRLDATNAADSRVSVLTPISLEHTQYLGKTITAIAGEKAGIIKPHWTAALKDSPVYVVSAPQGPAARRVIRRRCRQVGARLFEVNRRVIRRIGGMGLGGLFQQENAATAVKVVQVLRRFCGLALSPSAVERGLRAVRWPGRFERLRIRPPVIADGAMNPASAAALRKALRAQFGSRRLILVVGVSGDKDSVGILRALRPLAAALILTRSRNPRALAPGSLAFSARRAHFTGALFESGSVREGIQVALSVSAGRVPIVVTGSLFVVAEAREYFAREARG